MRIQLTSDTLVLMLPGFKEGAIEGSSNLDPSVKVSDQKKQVVQQELKKDIEEDSQKKGKGKVEEIKDDIDDVNKKVESKVAEKRSLTLEMVSRQRQEYMNALSSLVDEVKKQKKLVNLLLLVFLVLFSSLFYRVSEKLLDNALLRG
ncbi:inactive protein RESTRICTED TEV MOVEMENT [Trifolium repens]|nr:inactive protein RESTRICTED TEV MOVEMENT [Trifolium repens]